MRELGSRQPKNSDIHTFWQVYTRKPLIDFTAAIEMFAALLGFAVSYSIFDIISPIIMTKPGENGFWSFLGVATNMKSSVHFSPDSSRQNSAICHRIPTTSKIWSFSFRAKIGRGSLVFLATDEACPYWQVTNDVESWNGLSINMTKMNDKVHIMSHFLTHSAHTEKSLCDVDSDEIAMKISHSNGKAVVKVATEINQTYTACGEPIIMEQIPQMFFSFVGTSPRGIGDLEIRDAQAELPPTHREFFNITDKDNTSREEILMQQEKLAVLHPVLPLASAVIDEMEEASYRLENANNINTTQEIRALLMEVRNRMKQTLTGQDLQKLIHATLAVNLLKAERKMEKRKETFAAIEGELESLKQAIDAKLEWLGEYVVDVMVKAKSEAVDTLNVFLNMTKETATLKEEAKTRSKEAKSIFVPTLLYVIAFMELACYIAFFFDRRRKTHGFKKYD